MSNKQTKKFYHLTLAERLALLTQKSALTPDEQAAISGAGGLTAEAADHMIENAVGTFNLPLGIAQNFIINDREVLVPMAIEEPSVIAGASFMAKLARPTGGFYASSTAPEMIGQIQLLDLADPARARLTLLENKEALLAEVANIDPILNKLGGGPRDLEVRLIEDSPIGSVTIRMQDLAFEGYTGQVVRDGIIEAWSFAAVDPYRAATHNKGIMNGVDAVVLATGNDWRAVEAGAHAYAALNGHYTSLSTWSKDAQGDLVGTLEMPMAVGTVGGATRVHPTAKACLKLMGVKTAAELSQIIVSVGLAQNLAALRALATEGIQRGHMTLHARQVAIAAGASGKQVEQLADQLVAEKTVRIDRAEEIMREWSKT